MSKHPIEIRKNLIEGMEDSSGTWHETPKAIENIVTKYFSSLFTTSNPSEIERVIDTIQAVVSKPMNCVLGRDFQAMEVQQVLKKNAPNNNSRP